MTRAALYARVSTSDKDQDPMTQLLVLRDFCAAHSIEIHREYVDHAPANDLYHRTAWRDLLDDAAKHRFKVLLVFKLDRAFRSVKHMHDTLGPLSIAGVSFQSAREQVDTGTAMGRLLLNLLATLAEFELELIRERVIAGMDRARKQGKHIGRPSVWDKRGFRTRYNAVCERVRAGELSRRQAAKELGVGYATLKRYLDDPTKGLA